MPKPPTPEEKRAIEIKRQLHLKGWTLRDVAETWQCHYTTVSKALKTPSLVGERAIANVLGKPASQIWPDRYHLDGRPRHPRAHLQSNQLGGGGHRQKRKVA